MKILIINPLIPYPPNQGGRIVSFNLLKALSLKHDIYLITLAESPVELEYKKDLEKYCKHVEIINMPGQKTKIHSIFYKIYYSLYSIITGVPRRTLYFSPIEMKQMVSKMLSTYKFDAVHIEYSFTGVFAKYIKDIPMVLVQHNIEYVIYERLAKNTFNKIKKLKYSFLRDQIKKFELNMCKSFANILTLTDTDAQILKQDCPQANIKVLPFLTDIKFKKRILDKYTNKKSLLFVGSSCHPPNVEAVSYFCCKIFPEIKKVIPDINFHIVGNDAKYPVKQLNKINGVTINGYIEDIIKFYESCAVVVVPLTAGSGIKVKVLDAMSFGKPIVSTSIGMEGINVTDKKEVLIADDYIKFANDVIWLLNNEDARNRLGANAFQFVTENYNIDNLLKKVDEIYSSFALQ